MKKISTKKGFTLIETMVAIFILVLATLGPLTIAAQGLNQALFARDQITAYYLADEAIEYVRNVRDNNAINKNSDWLSGFDTYVNGNAFTIDSINTTTTQCSGACPPLYVNTDGVYSYSSSAATGAIVSPFTRTIKLTQITPDEYKISVTMNWRTTNIPKTFTINEDIFNTYKTS